ncbi:MAG: protein kinase [Deltaproteobacteria bacterium]|nr:protein kinase [Deltaproteobacteria bacterium]
MGCLSEAQLLELVEGRMSSVSETIESHLDACEVCRELVVVAASLEPTPEADDERYEIRGEVGRGGQSRVLRAYDRQLDREVALKQFVATWASCGEGPSPADRCLREVRVTGALSHPAIVPIHDMGMRRSGAPFYTMPIIEGPTLADVVERTPTTQARLRLLPHVVQVCQAVAYAHGKGFLHRDIKPANIMVGGFGQTLLLDWGLARLPGDGLDTSGSSDLHGSSTTVDGVVMGTPAYMSPEQASGDLAAVGQWSDVWGLGAVLYFVLCGHTPFRGSDVSDTLHRVRDGVVLPIDPPDGEVPPELKAIVRKAMAAAPRDRYPSATALADDLIAFQVGARVAAYSYRRRERVARFARRYRGLLAVAAVVFAALGSVTIVLARSYATEADAHARADMAADDAEQARARAEALGAENRSRALDGELQLARAHLDTAERERADRRPLTARLYAAASLHHNPAFSGSPVFEPGGFSGGAEARGLVERALGQIALDRLEVVDGIAEPPAPWSGDAEVYDADIEGGRVAIADGSSVARVLAGDMREESRLPGHQGRVRYIVLSPDGKYALTQDETETVRRWRLPEGAEDGRWPIGARGLARAAVSDDGAVAIKDDANGVALVRPGGQVPLRRLEITDPSQMRFSDDGQWLAVLTRDGRLHLARASDGSEIGRIDLGPASGATQVAFSHGGATIVASTGNRVAFVDRATLRPIGSVACAGHIRALAVSADDRRVFAASSRVVSILDAIDHRLLAELPSEVAVPWWVWTSGDRLLVAGTDRAAAWTIRPSPALPGFEPAARVHDRSGPIFHYAVARADAEVHVLDWTRAERRAEDLPGARPVEIVLSLGSRIAALHDDDRLTIWSRLGDRWQLDHARSFEVPINCIAASTDALRIAVLAADGRLWVIAADGSGDGDLALTGSAGGCRTLAFSQGGDRLVVGSRDPFLWDLRVPGAPPVRITVSAEHGSDFVHAIAFGDDDTIYAAGDFGVQEVLGDGSLGRRLTDGPRRTVHAGDGWLVASGAGGAIDLWRLPEGERVLATRASGAAAFFDVTVEPGGAALRLLGVHDSYVLPIAPQTAPDSTELLAASERAAGRTIADSLQEVSE